VLTRIACEMISTYEVFYCYQSLSARYLILVSYYYQEIEIRINYYLSAVRQDHSEADKEERELVAYSVLTDSCISKAAPSRSQHI
jgi:hypothetical protein